MAAAVTQELTPQAFVTATGTVCSRCGGLAAKEGAWLLPGERRQAVCASCMLWAREWEHVEDVLRRAPSWAPKPLKAHQPDGARFLARRNYALLADVPGLGKTAQALLAVKPGAPLMVLAPKTVVNVWYDEAPRWRPDIAAHHLSQGRWGFPGNGFVVATNYERAQAQLPPPGLHLILDEPHERVKNPDAQVTQRVAALARATIVRGGRVWLLTGTPLINRPDDMLDLLDLVLLGHAAYGTRKAYTDLFAEYYESPKRKRAMPTGLALATVRRQLAKVALRRTEESLPQHERLPPPIVQQVPVELSPEDAKVIHEHVRRLVAAKRTNEAVAQGILPNPRDRRLGKEAKERNKQLWQAHFEGVLQILTDPDEAEILQTVELALEHQGELPGFEELAKVRAALATAKIRAMIDLVEQLRAQGESVLVFSAHRAPVEALGARDRASAILGKLSTAKRRKITAEFQSQGLAELGLTITAGGSGLTLTAAAHEVFVDLDYRDTHNQQAMKRAHRFGQERQVTVHLLVANHAVDHRLLQITSEKAALHQAVLGDPIGDQGDEWWARYRNMSDVRDKVPV